MSLIDYLANHGKSWQIMANHDKSWQIMANHCIMVQNVHESGHKHWAIRLHRLIIRLLRTANFARALSCAYSFAHSLTSSLPSSWESERQTILNTSGMEYCRL